jgi:hypothetical protein
MNHSGKILLNQGFKLWNDFIGDTIIMSFDSLFDLTIVPKNGSDRKGFTFIIKNEENNMTDNIYG